MYMVKYVKKEKDVMIMTQFVRRLDNMCRIVIPAEYRKRTGITELTEVRITEENGRIIIEKLTPACKICGSHDNLNEKLCVCENCIEEIKSL